MSAQLEAHLRELAKIADLAQRDPQEALARVLAIKSQPERARAALGAGSTVNLQIKREKAAPDILSRAAFCICTLAGIWLK